MELVVHGHDVDLAWAEALATHEGDADGLPQLRRARLRYERRAERLRALLDELHSVDTLTEVVFRSADGLLEGTPDLVLVFPDHLEVIDYKTGLVTDSAGPKDAYVQQVRIYAGLASAQLDRPATRGVLLSMRQGEVEVDLSGTSVSDSLQLALEALHQFNERAPGPQPAIPSAANCTWCDFKPRCDAFWSTRDAPWMADLGVAVQGRVHGPAEFSISGHGAISIDVDTGIGTSASRVVVAEVPAQLVNTCLPDGFIAITGLRPRPENDSILRWTASARLAT